jgi:hypothetical protein
MHRRLSSVATGLLATAAFLAGTPALAFDSGSTGADGALAPTVDTVIQLPPSGILNYTSINIPQGVTVTFRKNALNTPVHLLVSGNATIAGRIAVWGWNSHDVGTFGDGNQSNDGIPGQGGPGGYDGGRGGRADQALRPEIIRGGAGLGPGGGLGGIEGTDGCSGRAYDKGAGMGAAHAEEGGLSFGRSSCTYQYLSAAARAKPYGSALLQPLVGGSGGGGGRGGTNYAGSGGGGGGGALLMAVSGTITLAPTGILTAVGGAAGGSAGQGSGGVGGGGSGGAIRLIATSVTGSGTIAADGGCVFYESGGRQCAQGSSSIGGGGAPGRIRIEAETNTFKGTSTPTYVADTPGPIFLSSIPSLRIDTIAGVTVSATPTGNGDVMLPADVVNPVTVTFRTTNVPAGNTVQLKVIPAHGDPIEALSPAITGTAESGGASVQVRLPQGPSVLQATTTYTIAVAMGEALSRFAGNERVERVQLVATLGDAGDPQVRLITVSGKDYLVPAAVLQQVGMPG